MFLRYAHRERVVDRDLSGALDSPLQYQLATLPRSIAWSDVRKILEAVDRRDMAEKRDYALVLLLVTYGNALLRSLASSTNARPKTAERRIFVRLAASIRPR
jgi:site-specific recombinase XerD